MSVLDNFGQWKHFLADRLNHAEHQGMNHETISNLATEIGGYLANHVEPKNEEEKVLADLWKVADENERHAIANMMVKLVQNDGSR
ncbi:DUF3243 domain-containing protein [Fictibacillus nanhaiensis]|uniref:DUF3243 domain-containing protein n=1 Tax=Fictibacillus nanhaiensis TaxID=742169 RepID=UPI001C985929|nr:DUF3243 domain-containing protein [Fictibacillus nanhaiensis]MBY6036025.1 DUF3243 domain-containing protein [Fictibacillus nanhaiensis]